MVTARYPVVVMLAALMLGVPMASCAVAQNHEPFTRVDFSVLAQPVFFDSSHTTFGCKYMCARSGYNLLFTDTGPVFQMQQWQEYPTYPVSLDFTAGLDGASTATPVGRSFSATYNFYKGTDPAGWFEGVKAYKRVDYRNIYPGVDLRVLGGDAGLVYQFVFSPGLSFDQLKFVCGGPAAALSLDQAGQLQVMAGSPYVEKPPVAWQITTLGKVSYSPAIQLLSDTSYGYTTPAGLNPSLPTVLEVTPAWESPMVWSGTTVMGCAKMTSRRDGRIVATGDIGQYEIPVLADPLGARYFTQGIGVAEMNADGKLLWCSLLNGEVEWRWGPTSDVWSYVYGLDVAPDGSVWIAGQIGCEDFPTLNPFQAHVGPSADAIVAKLARSSGRLLFSSLLGGSPGHGDRGLGVSVDAQGNAWVVGVAWSSSFPVINSTGSQMPTSGKSKAFIAKITAAGEYVWGYCYGGSSADMGYAVVADSPSSAWICGPARSTDLPVPGGFQTVSGGNQDVFIAHVTTADSLVWGSYLGGSNSEFARRITIGADRKIWIGGYTSSADFPTVASPLPQPGTVPAGFVAAITRSGKLAWSQTFADTYSISALATAPNGDIWAGGAYDGNWTLGHLVGTAPDNADSFIMRLNPRKGIRRATVFFGGGTEDASYAPDGIIVRPGKPVVSLGIW